MTVELREFADRKQQAEALADDIARIVKARLKTSGKAALAVPGGTTPGAFLTALGARKGIDWGGVAVTLTDERCVPATDERSNARLVRGTLLAAGATPDFVPLYARSASGTPALGQVDAALSARVLPLDAIVLGMGNDGHTASLFPGADALDEALDPDDDAAVVALTAPGAPEPRISLTLPAILSARHHAVLIAGQDKKETLERVLAGGPVAEAPIRAVFEGAATVTVYWAP